MNFLAELFVRLFAPTPKFFKTLGRIGWALGIVGGIAIQLTTDPSTPESWTPIISKIVTIIGVVTGLISQLATTSESKKEKGIED